MQIRLFLVMLLTLALLFAALGAQTSAADLEQILARVESRYAGPGFVANFFQTSTLSAMDITDSASGRIWVKRPGMMRWEYLRPERQTIVSNGKTLWIFRPDERQVMIGKAPEFLGSGQGASFLADMAQVRRRFRISLEEKGDNVYRLKLLPVEKTLDIKEIYLSVAEQTFDVVRIITYNAYGDQTRIDLSAIRFDTPLNDLLFNFEVPEGVDILNLDR